MERNGPLLPLVALLAAAGLFAGARLMMAPAAPPAPRVLSSVQLGMVALSMALFLYGAIGSISVWLEGLELRVGRQPARPGRIAVTVGLAGAVVLVTLSGLFARLIWTAVPGGPQNTLVQGSLAAAICFLGAGLVLVYRRSAITQEVVVEDERSEVPW